MAILAFQKPEKVIMLEATASFGKFEFRPLEPGFGMTVGNALRRVLLSSLEGYAITTVKVAGVKTPGLKEIHYEIRDFNAFAKPAWYADGVAILKELSRLGIESEVYKEKSRILDFQRKKTTQKVNLYEKVQIPGYQEALKNIMKQCVYTVGIPRKDAGLFSYQIDVTVTPNNSLADAFHEFEQGTYYSIDEVSAGLVTALEKYAAAPTYGTETTVTVPVNMETLMNADQEGSDLASLAVTILPLP